MLVDKEGTKLHRVAICTPCQDSVSAGYALDLAKLVGTLDMPYTLIQSRGTIIPQQRATLVTLAQQWGATHLLWLDSDMRFPPDTLHRLLDHGEPIVAANYPTRRQPILPTAEHKEHGLLFTGPDSEGLIEVSHVGMGVMLVDMQVFARMRQPWFQLGFTPKTNEYIGEDVFFLRRARGDGYRTLVDQGLSREVRHTGEMEFRAEHANVTRDIHNQRQAAHAAH